MNNDSRSTIIHMEKRSWDHFVSSGVLCCEASRLPTVEGSFCKNSYHTTERVYIANRCAHKDVSTHTERKFDDVCSMYDVRKEREAENSRVINKGHFFLLLCTLMQYKTRTSIFLIFLILNSGLSLYLCNGVHSYCES